MSFEDEPGFEDESEWARGGEIVTIPAATLVAQTALAGLFQIDGGRRREWLPWSQIDEGSPSKDGETGDLYIKYWIADERGLLDFTTEYGAPDDDTD